MKELVFRWLRLTTSDLTLSAFSVPVSSALRVPTEFHHPIFLACGQYYHITRAYHSEIMWAQYLTDKSLENWCEVSDFECPANRIPAAEVLKSRGFSKPFHSLIQSQFHVLLLVDHSIAHSATSIREKTRQFEAFMHDIY